RRVGARELRAMTAAAAQWQLDRLSTSARDAAEIASLGAGISLSAWLTKLIGDTCAADGVALPPEPSTIVEFTREIRDRTPAPVQPAILQPSIAPVGDDGPQTRHAPMPPRPTPPQAPGPSAPAMLPVAAMISANLGTRRG